MRITADTNVCISAGMCALTAPEVFDRADDDGLFTVTPTWPPRGAARGRGRGRPAVPQWGATPTTRWAATDQTCSATTIRDQWIALGQLRPGIAGGISAGVR